MHEHIAIRAYKVVDSMTGKSVEKRGNGMQRIITACVLVLFSLLFMCSAQAAPGKVEYLEAKPLSKVITPRLKPVEAGTKLVYVITWGGDVSLVYGVQEGIFRAEGLDISLSLENDFAKQVQAVLDGKTPYLRGTMGMINAATEVFKAAGTDLIVIVQLTWSTGGDTMTVRPSVRTPNDLKGKTIALQLYGPHMDYMANILSNAGMRPSQTTLRWLKELTLPTYDTQGAIVDPVSAFAADDKIDAIMAISPDALKLTSGGTVGTGAEGSVKGARILLSTKTASRIIADVYAVRKDYFDANRAQVQKFVHAMLRSQEALTELLANKSSQQAKYRQILAKSADLLLGAPQATADVESMLGDCEFSYHTGNVAFFTGVGTTRTLSTLTEEIQPAFIDMGLMTSRVSLQSAGWDYNQLAAGLKNTRQIAAPKFDPARAQQAVERQLAVEPGAWETEGTLFVIEIAFDPNQSLFAEDRYAKDYEKALQITQAYGGALVVVEGHSDPLGILQAQQKGERTEVLDQMRQVAKNLSLARANAVRGSFIQYAKDHSMNIDQSQFIAIGRGVEAPKYSPPRTKEEWAANRRVRFVIKQVEAELTEFKPLGN
jgi:ABC-type nitrate/sulfonate/bicarbonate transport system substrate-binding protein/outer membrane protein OmpA-like peptidoglycan-associated protein